MSDPKNPTPSLDVHNLDVHNLDVHNSETILDTGAAASGGAEPTLASGPAADSTTSRDLGSIGPYRLVKKLGEGGMGQVWLAEQSAPVKRRVALKVIKAGQYDDAALQRFDLERQTLAIMEHPAIAKVFDAGATAEGQPYFVMEYVSGLPITEYCDQKRLTLRERLDLITKVCEGVQHAHQKAIIRRDLNPSNILVVEVDGKPEAEELQRKTLDTQRRVLGLENSETLLSMNSLAATLLRQGRYAEAEKLYRQAFDLQRRVLGPENPHTLATMGSLGWTIAQEGRYAEAEKLERAAFEIERRVQGPEHQDTLTSMNAIVAICRGRAATRKRRSHGSSSERFSAVSSARTTCKPPCLPITSLALQRTRGSAMRRSHSCAKSSITVYCPAWALASRMTLISNRFTAIRASMPSSPTPKSVPQQPPSSSKRERRQL